MKKRTLSLVLCLCLLLTLLPMGASAAGVLEAGGWNETIWAKVTGVTEEQITGVSWSGKTTGALAGQDLQYLVRKEGDLVRIDIPGLPAGTYTLTVTTSAGTLTKSGIVVEEQDRSGFAHFNYTAGVGAYKDDGSLKSNAIVLYVTEENKNTVSVTAKDGTTVTGIGNILNSVGMDVGGGKSSKGGKANTNQDILRKLAADGTPLVVRIIGRVTAPAGLTAYDHVDYGGSVGDNGFMARMSGGKDITIEGIGADAVMDGWGLHFICQTADYARGWGKSFEVRNLTFRNVPEDCVGMEGQQGGSTLTAPVERCWIHHCSFYGPTITNPAESDKDGGDGACDFKRGQYFTNSYCYYEAYHKTNLVGSSDDSLQYHMTYHHNYWKDCESRGPLARQADIHMYNNIFEGQTSYCMSLRANSYIFSEYNLYIRCKNVTDGKAGGVCKSFGNSFMSCTGTDHSDLVIVTDKSKTVSSGNKYANFDTKAALSYIPGGKYVLQESIPEMKAVVLAQTGAQKQKLLNPEDVNISEIPTNCYPTAAVRLDYSKSLNKTTVTSQSGVFDNIVFNVAKIANDCITLGGTAGCDIVFYVDAAVDITIQEHSDTSNHVILCSAAGEGVLVGSGTAKNMPAGYYFIQSGTFDVGSGKFKEAKLAGLTIRAVDPDGATDPIPTVPPTEGSDDDPSGGATEGGNSGGDVVIPAGSYVHNFTESGKNSDFFSISGNLSKSKGTVTFQSMTLTQCLKIESETNISFTAPADGKLILVFNNAAGKKIKIDGVKQTIGSDSILEMELKAGSHAVTKADSINLFYMAFTTAGTQPPATDPTEPVTVPTEPVTVPTEPTVPVHRHSYIGNVTKPAHCLENGVKTYVCACGDIYTEVIPATGHSYGDWVVVKEATQDENGQQQRTCGNCGDVISLSIPKLPAASHTHSYTTKVTKEATCTEEGEKTSTCSCGAVLTESIPPIKHTYKETVTAATCGSHGSKVYTCGQCGYSYRVVLAATGNHHFGEKVTNGDGSVSVKCTVCGYTKTDRPDPTEPTEPGVTEPAITEPIPTIPEDTEPKPTEPEVTKPKPTEGRPTEPVPTEPKPTTPVAPSDEQSAGGWWWILVAVIPIGVAVVFTLRKKKETE